MTMLDSLQKAINNSVQVAKEWGRVHPNPSNKAPFNAVQRPTLLATPAPSGQQTSNASKAPLRDDDIFQ
jgi:hypothetical protein